MSADFALWFAAGALAFYVHDLTQLLPGNGLLLVRRGRRWSLCRVSAMLWFGRHPAWPAPLSGRAEVYRLNWSEDDARSGCEAPAVLDARAAALRPCGYLCTGLVLLLVVALPLAAWLYGSGWVLLAVVAAYYLLMLVALALLGWRRARAGLSVRDYWSIAFDCVACAPFAANLVRRVTLRNAALGEPLAFARAHLPPPVRAAMRGAILARTDDYLQAEAEGSESAGRLRRWRARVENELA